MELTDKELEAYSLTGRREIIYNLRRLVERGEKMSALFGQGSHSFLTVLIDVNEDDGEFYFDWGGSETLNQLLLRYASGVLVGHPEGVRVQIPLENLWQVTFSGIPAFGAPIPGHIVRLQRREYYRLELPHINPIQIELQGPQSGIMRLPLHDISVGGVGIRTPGHPPFETYGIYPFRLTLRDAATIDGRLEVRYIVNMPTTTGKEQWHLGCRFLGLNNRQEASIQRFMSLEEADRRARL